MDFEETMYYNLRKKVDKEVEEYTSKYGEMKTTRKNHRWSMDDYYMGFLSQDEKYSSPVDMTVAAFDKRINCGGYALQVDGCFFPNGARFSNYVSALLEEFDFIRLLGDKPLQDDEYLVIYRFSDYEETKGRNNGHHFIRVNDDGLVVDKYGGDSPRIFPGWNPSFEDSPEAVFAVKKDHSGLFDDIDREWGIFYDLKGGLDFDETVCKAIDERNNSFSYHCHNYRLKKSRDGNIYVTDEKGEIVADFIEEENERVAIARPGKEEYVENLHGPVRPIIENGRLVNLKDFKNDRNNREEVR